MDTTSGDTASSRNGAAITPSAATDTHSSQLLPSRAASEVIWAMGRTLDRRAVAIPLPAYTDYLRVFPGRGFGSTTGRGHSIGQLEAALAAARLVLMSNPHNPTGSLLGPDELMAAALRHPRSVLVVDESFRVGRDGRGRRADFARLGRAGAGPDAGGQPLAGRRLARAAWSAPAGQ